MEDKHWTKQRILAVLLSLIGVITAMMGWLIAYNFIPPVINEGIIWSISMISIAFATVFCSQRK